MSNAVKNIVSVAAALGLIYSMFAGACVGAADSFAENSDISKIKAVSAEKNQSYSEYRAAALHMIFRCRRMVYITLRLLIFSLYVTATVFG